MTPRLPGLPSLPRVRVPLRLRALFRLCFVLLAATALALAYAVLKEEKQLAQRAYREGLRNNQAQIAARLKHPTGQLALLNPGASSRPATPVVPVVLPFSAIDFDDRSKVQQAVEMAGCLLQYPQGQTLCAAVGSNPAAGGFLYVVGSLATGALVGHRSGELDLATAHRVHVRVATPEQAFGWVAAYQPLPEPAPTPRGRLVGFADDAPVTHETRPVRDFRGWLWQDGRCADGATLDDACPRRSFFSVRLPVEVWRDQVWRRPNPQWPPAGLAQMQVRVQVLAPGAGAPLFDSNSPGAVAAFSLADLQPLLLPGETLTLHKLDGSAPARELLRLAAPAPATEPGWRWLEPLVRRIPVPDEGAPLTSREVLATPLGRYEMVLAGDLHSVNTLLAAVAARVGWFVAAMLAAILATWAVIELLVIRRITLLTKRAAAVAQGMRQPGSLPQMDVADLKGSDELGVLAGGLQALLQRVQDDLRREQLRAQQEKDQWHAVGHEIMSPLQSLLALHGTAGDPSHRYIARMQQAVRVLYGQASPSEAIAATTLAPQALELDGFLAQVAANVPMAGVHYSPRGRPLWVQADEHALEDVLGHVLANAQRHRSPGTPVRITVDDAAAQATVVVHNQGEPVPQALLERIFEYGVSGSGEGAAAGSRGQGLFVARTYMAKMGGSLQARNAEAGVALVLQLPRLPQG